MATSALRERQTQHNVEDREAVSRARSGDYEERDGRSSHEQIAQLAYLHWQSRGCPLGSPEEDWLQAELAFQEQHHLTPDTT